MAAQQLTTDRHEARASSYGQQHYQLFDKKTSQEVFNLKDIAPKAVKTYFTDGFSVITATTPGVRTW